MFHPYHTAFPDQLNGTNGAPAETDHEIHCTVLRDRHATLHQESSDTCISADRIDLRNQFTRPKKQMDRISEFEAAIPAFLVRRGPWHAGWLAQSDYMFFNIGPLRICA